MSLIEYQKLVKSLLLFFEQMQLHIINLQVHPLMIFCSHHVENKENHCLDV